MCFHSERKASVSPSDYFRNVEPHPGKLQ